MTNLKWAIFIFIYIFANTTFAHTASEGKVTALFGPFIYRTKFNGGTDVNSPYLGSLGLIAEGDLNSNGGLEIGIFHMNKIFFRQSNGNYMVEQTELVDVTMGYRYWWNQYFSSALAFYSTYSIGAPTVIHNGFAVGSEIDTSARDITEYGFDISLQAELWSKDRFAVVLDTRYAISVTSKQNEEEDHYGFVLGLRYLIQEKFHEKKYKSPTLKR